MGAKQKQGKESKTDARRLSPVRKRGSEEAQGVAGAVLRGWQGPGRPEMQPVNSLQAARAAAVSAVSCRLSLPRVSCLKGLLGCTAS